MTKGATATATKSACQLFADQQTELDQLRARIKGRKMDDKLRKRIEDLENKVHDAKLACADETVYDVYKDQINKEIMDLVYHSIGGLRDGFVDAAVRFSIYAKEKKVANSGFVLVVPDAAVQAAGLTFSQPSMAIDMYARVAGGSNSPIAKSLDPKGPSVEKTLNQLTANMGNLSKLVSAAFNNFAGTLRSKNSKLWMAIAIDWTQNGRKPLTQAALERFYNSTGIPRPTKFGDKIFYAMATALNEWIHQGQAQEVSKVQGENKELPGRKPEELQRQLRANKDTINKEIDRTVNESINFIRDNLQDVGTIFQGWVAGQPNQPNSAALAMDVAAAVTAIAAAVFPPATVAFTIVSGIITVAKGPITDGLDKQKDGQALAAKLAANLAATSAQLGSEFTNFGERLYKDDPKLWNQIGLALSVPTPEFDPEDPDFKPSKMDSGMDKEADKLLYDKAGVPRMTQNHAKPVLKKLIAIYLRWELKNRPSLPADPDTIKKAIDPSLVDKEANEIAEQSLALAQKSKKKTSK